MPSPRHPVPDAPRDCRLPLGALLWRPHPEWRRGRAAARAVDVRVAQSCRAGCVYRRRRSDRSARGARWHVQSESARGGGGRAGREGPPEAAWWADARAARSPHAVCRSAHRAPGGTRPPARGAARGHADSGDSGLLPGHGVRGSRALFRPFQRRLHGRGRRHWLDGLPERRETPQRAPHACEAWLAALWPCRYAHGLATCHFLLLPPPTSDLYSSCAGSLASQPRSSAIRHGL